MDRKREEGGGVKIIKEKVYHQAKTKVWTGVGITSQRGSFYQNNPKSREVSCTGEMKSN